ncbi:MAG: hypothetical protein ACP5XB_01310 [Isosphaeraceae bacterium]
MMPAPDASRSGAGSLRQAIISSDAVKGPNAINFNIPGSGVHTINLLSEGAETRTTVGFVALWQSIVAEQLPRGLLGWKALRKAVEEPAKE